MVKVPAATAAPVVLAPVVEEEKTDTLDSILNSESDADVPTENSAAPNAEAEGTEPTAEDAAPTISRTSTKTREARNVPEGFTTTWVPIDIPNEESLILKRAAKILGTNVAEMLSVKLKPAYEAAKADFKTEADKFVPTRATPVDKLDTPEAIAAAQAKLTKMQMANKKLADAIAARLAQQAAKNAPPVEETDAETIHDEIVEAEGENF